MYTSHCPVHISVEGEFQCLPCSESDVVLSAQEKAAHPHYIALYREHTRIIGTTSIVIAS